MSEGVFGQLEYNQDKLSAFASGAVSNTTYWRYDRFYYMQNTQNRRKLVLSVGI